MIRSVRAAARVLVAVVGLAALFALLLRVGGPPALDEVDGADPVAVISSLLRLVALVTCGYLLLATSLGLAARLTDCRSAVRLLDRVTLPSVRRLLRDVAAAGAVSAAVGAGAALTPSLAFAQARPPVLHQLPDPTTTTSPSTPPATAAPPSPVTLHRLDDAAPPPTPDPPPAPPQPPPAPPAPPESTTSAWVIAPGDHLWHVSQATLVSARGRPPSDAETVVYLRALIERNRGVFAVPGNVDLVFPGQRFELPPP